MADPLTAAAVPTELRFALIATLILTKAFEKQGEKIGEKVFELGGKLLTLLKQKDLKTATAIEQVAQNPRLAEQQPADFGEAKLIEQVEQLAIGDPEVKAAIEAVAALAKKESPQAWAIENWKGINIKGGENTISGNTFNFN
jgi:hypothetical protein